MPNEFDDIKLTQEEKDALDAKNPSLLPLNPTAQGWSGQAVRAFLGAGQQIIKDLFDAQAERTIAHFEETKATLEEHATVADENTGRIIALETITTDQDVQIAQIIDGTIVVSKATSAEQDEDGNNIKDTYATKTELSVASGDIADILDGTQIAKKAEQDENGNNIYDNYVRLGDYPNTPVLDENSKLPNSYLQDDVPILDENDKLDNAWLKDDVPLIDSKNDKGIVFYDATQGKIDTDTTTTLEDGDIKSSKGAFTIENTVSHNNIYLGDDIVELNSGGSLDLYGTAINISAPTVISGATASPTLTLKSAATPHTKIISLTDSDGVSKAYIDKDGNFYCGDINIAGNIIQQGSAYETHAEHIYTTKDHIILRDGAVGGLAVGAYAGLFAKLADGTNDSAFVFDGNGIARVGDISYDDDEPDYSNTQALATRQDTPTSNGIPYWNDTAKRFDTSSGLVSDLGDNATAGLTINKLGTGYIQEWKLNGTSVAALQLNGNLMTAVGISLFNANNAAVQFASTGTTIRRNASSSGVALTINQNHADSTSNIANFQFGGANKLEITKDGFITQNGVRYVHNIVSPTGSSATPAGQNTFLGLYSGNLYLGSTATSTAHGSYNVAVGQYALTSGTTAGSNVAVGHNALRDNTSGLGNVAIGRQALLTNTSGGFNVGIGYYVACFIADGTTPKTTGNYGVYIGSSAKASADGTSNEIVIGYDAIGAGTDTATIGNTSLTKIYSTGGLDISNGSIALIIGADSSARTRTNNIDKYARLGIAHYTNAEEPLGVFYAISTNTENQLSFGGGSGFLNAATVLRFFTAANNTTTTGTERMRITSAGNVGIGTDSPNYQLHINGTSTTAYLQLTNSTTGSGAGDGFRFYVSGLDATLTNSEAGYFRIETSNTERLRVLSTGLIGINQTTPTSQLHIVSGATDRVGLIVSNPTSTSVDIAKFQVNNVDVCSINKDGVLVDNNASAGTDGQILQKVDGKMAWTSKSGTYAGPTDTLLGSRASGGLIDFGTDSIYDYDEIIVELVFNNSPEFIKTRTYMATSQLAYGAEEPAISVLGFDGSNLIQATVQTTGSFGDELNVGSISGYCTVNIYGRNW